MKGALKLLPVGSRTGNATQSELVPQARLSGPIPWVIAIMVMLTVIAAAGGFALRNLAKSAANELAGGVTVQIVEARGDVRDAQAKRAVEILKSLPGVTQVKSVPQHEVDAIEPWLGARAAGDEAIPVPALVDARLRDPLTAETLGALRRAVREVAPDGRVDGQSSWLKPVFSAIQSLQWLSLALVGLLAFATSAAVLLAVRSALGSNRDTIEIVHLLGGTDAQIARIFQRSVGFDAAGGGAVGLALGLVVVLFLGQQFAELGAGLVNSGALVWSDWLLLALVPAGFVLLAMLTARITVLAALKRML